MENIGYLAVVLGFVLALYSIVAGIAGRLTKNSFLEVSAQRGVMTVWALTTVASGVFGLAMAGVIVGWMLGPVALAPSPEKVPHYVAIHATLVGIRGILFQSLGMFLYRMSGSFTWPLALASFAFVAGAWQMWKLHGRMGGSGPRKLETPARQEAAGDRA